jgi:hypothetical protein
MPATTVSELTEALQGLRDRLAAAGTVEAIPHTELPSHDEIAQWTAALFTDRGGRLRQRSAPAKGATNVERAVHGLTRWHSSGGSLEGLFIAKWNAGEAFDRVDTYVDLVLVASGRRSAAAAWAATGLFTTTTSA